MGFKCVPQFTGLVKEMPSKGGRHRMPGEKIAKENGKERASKSATLDRRYSDYNAYDGYESGEECWQSICDEADEYRIRGKTKNGKDFERKLGKNAVIGWGMVIKPPCEVVENWTYEEFDRFDRDAWEVMGEICPDLFRDDNVRMVAEHRDEGLVKPNHPHRHRIGISKSEDGKFCGNLIDPMLYVTVNERFPQMMRDRGWDLEDLDRTDWEKYAEDDDYKAERDNYRKSYGQRVNAHIAQRNSDTVTALDAKQAEIDAKYEAADNDIAEYESKAKRYIKEQVKAKDAEIKAEKAKAVKQVKDRLLVDYQIYDEAVQKSEMASERINNMSGDDLDADFKAYISVNKPYLLQDLEQSRIEWQNSLNEAVKMPEMPETVTEIIEETKLEAKYLKQVAEDFEADQRKLAEIEKEKENAVQRFAPSRIRKSTNRELPVIEADKRKGGRQYD